ncbi:MAG TPA: zinc ribbon domain-containing protein [Acidobacteriota bacterium]|nr:zinc ribbon domain-containing protein [Acidobacteriota bacterium]
MAFCAQCGSPVEGDFCSKCGAKVNAPVAAGVQAPPVAPAESPIVIPAPQAQKSKKGRVIFWVLGGCLGLIIIAGIIFFAAGLFIAHKAGIDSGSFAKNPGVAIAKMMLNSNPDVEIVSVDEDHGIIRVREKKTGKILTVDMENAQKGKIVFTDEKDQKVEITTQGEGNNAAIEVKSADGSLRIGAESKNQLPEWLPSYPNAESATGTGFSANQGKSGSFSFKSKDSVETVAAFYEKALKSAGFQIQKSASQIPGQGSIVIISASDSQTKRTANVTAARTEEGTTINLAYETK